MGGGLRDGPRVRAPDTLHCVGFRYLIAGGGYWVTEGTGGYWEGGLLSTPSPAVAACLDDGVDVPVVPLHVLKDVLGVQARLGAVLDHAHVDRERSVRPILPVRDRRWSRVS